MLGIIKVISVQISSVWCYKSHFRKNELIYIEFEKFKEKDILQNSKIWKIKNFRVLGVLARHDPGVITTPL